MNNIEIRELKEIKGGTIKFGTALGIAAAVIFLIGVIDGFVNPTACRRR